MRFVDTNVLLYAVSRDHDEQVKSRRANSILATRDVAVSVQVLQEFYVHATRPSRQDPLSHAHAAALVESFARFPVQDLTLSLVQAVMTTCDRFGISSWDAAIIEASRSLGCHVLLPEDLSDGQDYAGVRVENPFRPGWGQEPPG